MLPEDIQNQLEPFANQAFSRIQQLSGQIPVNIERSEDEYYVVADVTGFSEDEIELTLQNDHRTFIITAESSNEQKYETPIAHSAVQQDTQIRQPVKLPNRVDPESVEANYKNGVLEIIAETEDEDTNEKIEIDIYK